MRNLLDKDAIQPSTSPYNSPLFCVKKPLPASDPHAKPSYRIVQDFRALNLKTLDQKYVLREIQECITAIGLAQSTIFSTIDLKSAFWQLPIRPEDTHKTAFTVPGMGHFEWKATSMGLCGAPGSFSMATDHIFGGQKNIICYVDDLLIHSATFTEHLEHIETCLTLLHSYNLKINLKKSKFCSNRVFYLGYELTSKGIAPGLTKAETIRTFPVPSSIRALREFLGVANYYRSMIPDFNSKASKLSALLKKNSGWKEGILPPDALAAFTFLQNRLAARPVLNFPHPTGKYILTTDACTGSSTSAGGFGAVLQQLCPNNELRTVSFASRALKAHEKNYSPFKDDQRY